MDYSQIKLENERNAHVTKRLNRLSAWSFFKVLYRDNMWRLFGYSLLMLLCIVPVVIMFYNAQVVNLSWQRELPMFNAVGFSTGVWDGVDSVYQAGVTANNYVSGAQIALSGLIIAVVLSGGFAVIRDSFWTGKLSTVGVFKSMWLGFKANFLYAIASAAIMCFGAYGLFAFYTAISALVASWIAIVLLVLLCIAFAFLAMYLTILCSVSVTYKQSPAQNLKDSWLLMWMNVIPNLVHFLLMLVPVGLYFVFSGGVLQSLYMVLLIMFGGMYVPLVWQVHMMKTFALFHPVEARKKKGQAKGKQPDEIVDAPAF